MFILTKDQLKEDSLSNFKGLKIGIPVFWKKQNGSKSDCVLILMVEWIFSARRWKFQNIKVWEIESYLLLLFLATLKKGWVPKPFVGDWYKFKIDPFFYYSSSYILCHCRFSELTVTARFSFKTQSKHKNSPY